MTSHRRGPSFIRKLGFALALVALPGAVAEIICRVVDWRLDPAAAIAVPRARPQPASNSRTGPDRFPGAIPWRGSRPVDEAIDPRVVWQNNHLALPLALTDPNDPVVVVVGGSTAYGDGVGNEQTFAALLDRRLPEIEVLNAGQNGANSVEVRRTAQKIVRHFQSGVLVVLTGNNEWLYWDWPEWEPWTRRAQRYLAFSMAYRYLAREFRHRSDARWRTRPFDPRRGCSLLALTVNEQQVSAWRAAKRERLAAFEENLSAIVRQGRRNGFHVLLCRIPFRLRLCPAYFIAQPAAVLNLYAAGETAEKAGRRAEAVARYAEAREAMAGNLGAVLSINKVIGRVGAAEGAVVIDVASALRRVTDHPLAADEIFVDFCHLNESGHRIIAELLLPTLQAAVADLQSIQGRCCP